jgi:hypothetical protein
MDDRLDSLGVRGPCPLGFDVTVTDFMTGYFFFTADIASCWHFIHLPGNHYRFYRTGYSHYSILPQMPIIMQEEISVRLSNRIVAAREGKGAGWSESTRRQSEGRRAS